MKLFHTPSSFICVQVPVQDLVSQHKRAVLAASCYAGFPQDERYRVKEFPGDPALPLPEGTRCTTRKVLWDDNNEHSGDDTVRTH